MEQKNRARKPRGRRLERLTTEIVKASRPRAKQYGIADGRGLALIVLPSGSKSWRVRYRLHGTARVYVVGPYPEVTLEEAREATTEVRRLVMQGLDPVGHRRQERSRQKIEHERQRAEQEAEKYTVERCVADWIDNKKWTRDTEAVRVRKFMQTHLLPMLGKHSLASLTPAAVARWRDELAKKLGPNGKPLSSMAKLTHGWLRAAIKRAKEHGHIGKEHAAELLEVERASHANTHRTPLTAKQIGAFWHDLDKLGEHRDALAFKLLLLLFTRPGELLKARWEELDLTNEVEVEHEKRPLPLWRIPAARQKMSTQHLVPLSPEAVELFERLRKLTGWSEYVFPARVRKGRPARKPMTKIAWRDFLRDIGWETFKPHAARATASTLLREALAADSEVIELQLGHLRRDRVRASYDFASRLPQRFEMMKRWSKWVVSQSRVIDLPAPKKRTA